MKKKKYIAALIGLIAVLGLGTAFAHLEFSGESKDKSFAQMHEEMEKAMESGDFSLMKQIHEKYSGGCEMMGHLGDEDGEPVERRGMGMMRMGQMMGSM